MDGDQNIQCPFILGYYNFDDNKTQRQCRFGLGLTISIVPLKKKEKKKKLPPSVTSKRNLREFTSVTIRGGSTHRHTKLGSS